MKNFTKFFFAGIALFSGSYASAIPESGRILPKAPETSELSMLSEYDFEGIIELSNCSGSLVRFVASDDSDPAILLTNGHCHKMIDPGVVYVNEPSSRTFTILGKDASRIGRLHAQKLLYATMTSTDIALYQLKETYSQIRSRYNTEPFTLAAERPDVGTQIQIVSGYWKRGYSCAIDAMVYSLKEGNWLFMDSIRYSKPGCEVIGGTSGSPIIASGSRKVIAINNTTSESGSRCTINNPCEIDEKGNVAYKRGNSYGQQTYWIYSCLTDDRQLDIAKDGCLLPKPH